ncbi:MAG: EamA family transporter [Acidobacteria bacterium]|nr:EamA family transporter [Acidobacteriota bacterium]
MTERPAAAGRAPLLFAFAAIYVAWGSTYLAIRFAIETIPPFFVAGSRHLAAGALLYGWARARGGTAPTRAQWLTVAGLGALMLLGGNGAVTWSEQRVPSGLAAAEVSARSLLSVGYLVVFGSLIGFSAYVWLMRVSTPARVATYAYVNPVVAVALGAAFGGEPLTLRTLLASAVIVLAVVAIVSAPRPK